MADLKMHTSLSMEEIEKNFEGIDFFSGVVEGLNEALEHKEGNPSPHTVIRKRELPDVNVAAIRESLCVTQRAFATILGVSCRTVEAWESGKSNPTPTAKKLMFLIQEDHNLISKLQPHSK